MGTRARDTPTNGVMPDGERWFNVMASGSHNRGNRKVPAQMLGGKDHVPGKWGEVKKCSIQFRGNLFRQRKCLLQIQSYSAGCKSSYTYVRSIKFKRASKLHILIKIHVFSTSITQMNSVKKYFSSYHYVPIRGGIQLQTGEF